MTGKPIVMLKWALAFKIGMKVGYPRMQANVSGLSLWLVLE